MSLRIERCLLWIVFAGAFVPAFGLAEGDRLQQRLRSLESTSKGRLGVAALDVNSGRRIGYRGSERFPMCSTFKLLLVGVILERVDRKIEKLDRVIKYSRADLVANSPVTQMHMAEAGLPIDELCVAAMTESDNTATNLLLRSVGGPKGLTASLRAVGDKVTRLDRFEPAMSESRKGDPRDTSTPAEMMAGLQRFVLGKSLSMRSRSLLKGWLLDCKTGGARIRAGLPKNWKVGDKTGSGPGTTNDVAILWPSNNGPVLVSVYLTGSSLDAGGRDGILAKIGSAVAENFALSSERGR